MQEWASAKKRMGRRPKRGFPVPGSGKPEHCKEKGGLKGAFSDKTEKPDAMRVRRHPETGEEKDCWRVNCTVRVDKAKKEAQGGGGGKGFRGPGRRTKVKDARGRTKIVGRRPGGYVRKGIWLEVTRGKSWFDSGGRNRTRKVNSTTLGRGGLL